MYRSTCEALPSARRRRWLRRLALVSASFGAILLPTAASAVVPGFNGRIVFVSGRDSPDGNDEVAKLFLRTITSGTGAGSTGPTITPAGGQHKHPNWSPDRTRIAYSRGVPGTPATENFDIYIQDLETGTVTPITNTADSLSADRAAWSPDGTRIVYEQQTADNSAERDLRIYTVATGQTTPLPSLAPIETKAIWTPDGQTLYYVQGDANVNANIVRRSADGVGGSTLLIPDSGISEFQPALSPDGTKLCYTLGTGFNNATDIMLVSLATPNMSFDFSDNPVNGDFNCVWSPDGTKIAYVQGAFGAGMLLMEQSDDTGAPIVLEDDPQNFDGNPDWAPDGRPACQNATVTVPAGKTTPITLACADTGPAYERTNLTVDIPADGAPTKGSLSAITQGPPATVAYTPNPGFVGTDSFQVRVRDELAFGDQRGTITVQVKADTTGDDTTAPTLSAVTVAPRTWRRGLRTTPSPVPVGTRIGFRLSEDASVAMTFQRLLPGRRVGGQCLPATPARRTLPRCDRVRIAGTITRANAKAGTNSVAYRGRLGPNKRLGIGRYRVILRATDARGNRSPPRASRAFRIVAG